MNFSKLYSDNLDIIL